MGFIYDDMAKRPYFWITRFSISAKSGAQSFISFVEQRNIPIAPSVVSAAATSGTRKRAPFAFPQAVSYTPLPLPPKRIV